MSHAVFMSGEVDGASPNVGASPGLEHDEIARLPDGAAPVRVTCIDYGPDKAQVQIIEIIETFRERASDLTDSYMSHVSNHMNEIMKVLTIIGTIFIPLTFLAGVYGMNFRHFPELEMGWAYPAFWIVCAVVAGIMALFFRRKGWL